MGARPDLFLGRPMPGQQAPHRQLQTLVTSLSDQRCSGEKITEPLAVMTSPSNRTVSCAA